MATTARIRPHLSALDRRDLPSGTPFQPAPEFSVISNTPHAWAADADGLYHTTADLGAEWAGFYAKLLAGQGSTLTPVQRLEGNAQAVYLNTNLKHLNAAKEDRFREDAQREFDAIAVAQQVAQQKYGSDPSKPLTERAYLRLGAIIQSTPDLYELGVQGHGLNNPPATRYRGYTTDVQNRVDNTTLFVGGGLDNNESAVNAFFDDVLMSHLPFPVVFQDGMLTQLNQNADAEDELADAVVGTSEYMYGRVLTAKDFAKTASDANDNYVSPLRAGVEATAVDLSAKPSGGKVHGLLGDVPTTLSGVTPHKWVADGNGLFHTSTDLSAEWKGYYAKMLSGHAGDLTPVQRLEGNAEAVFQAAGLNKLDAATQDKYREDSQRQFDAMAAALKQNEAKFGFDPTDALTPESYFWLGRTIQADATLKELADQGHGLNNAPNVRYAGFTNDFQNSGTTKYVGGGQYNCQNVLGDFFDNQILTHTAFAVVFRNGKLQQLNQNGNVETTLKKAVASIDVTAFYRVYLASDFKTK